MTARATRLPERLARMRAGVPEWARRVRRDVKALALGLGDPRVGWPAKTAAALVVAYALSPIDLIPDFIPILGMLDDAVLVPLGILVCIRLIPVPVLADLRARSFDEPVPPRLRRLGIGLVVFAWALLLNLGFRAIAA